MKLTKKLFSIVLCFLMVASLMVVAVPANAREYAIIEFEGLDMPVPNERPDFEVASLCDDYGVLNYGGNDMIIWIDEETGNELEYYDSFVAGHDYRVKIYFEPTSNQVEFVEGAKFMMDGTGLGWYIYQDSNGMYAQYYFDTCGQIKDACIYIDEPVAGATPDFEPKHDNRYVIEGNKSPVKNGVSWYDETEGKFLVSGTADAVFKCQHVYKVIFDLRSYTCDFDGNASINVNRFKGEYTWAAPSFATVEYTFAELGCAPVLVEATAATCKTEGNIEHYACSCGKFYKDEYATEEILDVVIPKLDHTPSNLWVITKPATETEEGEKVKKCEVCEEVVETAVIEKLEPTTQAPTTVAPTTEAPTTVAPTTEAPTTEAPTTVAPTTVEPTTIAPTTVAPTTAPAKVVKLSVPKFKLISGKKQFKVKYTKVKDATGFQVRYKLKGKWITKTFNTKKNATKAIKKLKKGTYKVQVRAMAKGGKYSAWSKTSKVKVK